MMIDPKALRVGNKLLYQRTEKLTEVVTVSWVSDDSIGYYEEHEASYPHSANRYSGIPLNPEWLGRLGFPGDKSTIDLGGQYSLYFERQEDKLFVEAENTDVKEVCYVHEAQNIYFCMTGEELIIKE